MGIITAKSFHTFNAIGKKKNDMISITLTMSKNMWKNIHENFNVDIGGKPYPTDPIPTPQQLIWEQKIRKEKEK